MIVPQLFTKVRLILPSTGFAGNFPVSLMGTQPWIFVEFSWDPTPSKILLLILLFTAPVKQKRVNIHGTALSFVVGTPTLEAYNVVG
jgi:hypothetical protein